MASVGLVDLPLPELRQQVALVTQEQHVFVGTLADNLRLAHPSASDADLERALKAVDWALTLPLSTVIGSGGHALTPSQAQQVALARLVLSDPHTLVLDEATSLLDPRAARHLERSLSAVLSGRTVVAVAHRLHTAHDADRVAVVEGGRITELGTHDELLQHNGSYAALWRTGRTPDHDNDEAVPPPDGSALYHVPHRTAPTTFFSPLFPLPARDLGGERIEWLGQCVEGTAEPIEPVPGTRDTGVIDRVHPTLPLRPHLHQPGVAQDLEVVRDRRLGNPATHRLDQHPGGLLPGRQQVQQLTPDRVTQRFEHTFHGGHAAHRVRTRIHPRERWRT